MLKLQLQLLKLVNVEEIFLLKFIEDAIQLFWVVECPLIFIVILRHIDQVSIQKVIESLSPLCISHPITLINLLTPSVATAKSWPLFSILQECKLHLYLVMNLLVILENDIVLGAILLVLLNPLGLQDPTLHFHLLLPFLAVLWSQFTYEVFILFLLN